jgi:ribosomal protein S18 acetylase RimI-like enzyme
MSVAVRRFTADEWRIYRALRLRALRESPDAFGSTFDLEVVRVDSDWQDRLARAATASDELPLVALVDDTPAGLCWGRVDELEPDVADLFQVWVAPEYRGHGVSRLLVETAVTWARAAGLRILRLDVTSGNSAAINLYRRLGFVETGTSHPLRPGSALQCLAMELAL